MRPLLVLRPEPGNAETMARMRILGLMGHAFPLFAAEQVAWEAPSPNQFDALLLTSANTVRFAGDGLDMLKSLPAYCVGEATANAAQDAGFVVAYVGQSGVDELLASVPNKRLLHLCGEDRIDHAPPSSTITALPCYRTAALPPALGLFETLKQHPIAMLHSPRAARHFAQLVDASLTPRSKIALCALSQNIADAAGVGWEAVAISPHPRDDEALKTAMSHFKLMPRPSE